MISSNVRGIVQNTIRDTYYLVSINQSINQSISQSVTLNVLSRMLLSKPLYSAFSTCIVNFNSMFCSLCSIAQPRYQHIDPLLQLHWNISIITTQPL